EYRNGVREGEWKGTFLKQKYTFTETYKGGLLVSGESVDENNNKFPYSNLIISPKFGSTPENSVNQFRKDVQKIFRPSTRAMRAQANGMISVEFVINEAGETAEFKILEDPGYGLGYEAINAIKLAGKWTPGLNRGVPVRVKQVLPLRVSFRVVN
ncbi:MAG TPA: energy transducer TonB, partial [Sphingobacteriaceae bacterium]|nr:energy transducer TonB [Sphingobacteriaceae bacterium]